MHDFSSLKEKQNYVDAYMSKLAELRGEDFDEGKPLWRIDVITPGLRDGSTCVFQFHHCLSDGMGLVMFAIKSIVDKDPILLQEISDRVDSIVRKRRGGSISTRLLRGLRYFESYVYAFGNVLTHLVMEDASMPSSPFRGKHVESNKWVSDCPNVTVKVVEICFLKALCSLNMGFLVSGLERSNTSRRS
mmetsp:Transcript_28394/g.111414  ORF Transcript_28394/g.111414 Transcript_28394/m.111414 type:complete len:189 (+) Transcript_28394:736-1302(+)